MIELPKREVVISDAVIKDLPLLFAIFGIWGGGKTASGLRICKGIQEVYGGDIHVIDTEARRALEYADQFKFKHVPFDPPHNALDYCTMIETCLKRGAKVIQVDSMTNEHSGIGGYLDFHDAEVERLIRESPYKTTAGKVSARARIKPATNRKELIRRISDVYSKEAAFVFCFRGQEKLKFNKPGDKGQPKQDPGEEEEVGKPVEMGYMPDTKASMLWMMTAAALLLPRADGVPTWNPDKPGEKLMVKRGPDAFKAIFQMDKTPAPALNEMHGRKMAERAKGSAPRPPASSKEEPIGAASGQPSLEDRAALLKGELKKCATKEAVEKLWNHSRAKAIRAELLKHPDAKILEELSLSYEARITTLEEAERARLAELEAGK